jgi:hypothetical protein
MEDDNLHGGQGGFCVVLLDMLQFGLDEPPGGPLAGRDDRSGAVDEALRGGEVTGCQGSAGLLAQCDGVLRGNRARRGGALGLGRGGNGDQKVKGCKRQENVKGNSSHIVILRGKGGWGQRGQLRAAAARDYYGDVRQCDMQDVGRDSRRSGCEKGFSHQGFLHQRQHRTRIGNLLCALGGALLLVAGCQEGRVQSVNTPEDGQELPILRQSAGTHSHETRPMKLVVRDTDTLAQVPLADVPVNFAEEMLLVVTLGRVTTDQCAVRIERVWRERGRLRVKVNVRSSGAAPPVMASPYCIAVVPRCDLNVADFSAQPPKRTRSWDQSTPPENWGAPK